jgi:hypothetical protein
MENLLALAKYQPGAGEERMRIYSWTVSCARSLRVTAYNVLQARAVAVGGVLLKELFNLHKPDDVELLRKFVLCEPPARDAVLARIKMGSSFSEKNCWRTTRARCASARRRPKTSRSCRCLPPSRSRMTRS